MDVSTVESHDAGRTPDMDDGGDMLTLHEEDMDYAGAGPAAGDAFKHAVQVVRQRGGH